MRKTWFPLIFYVQLKETFPLVKYVTKYNRLLQLLVVPVPHGHRTIYGGEMGADYDTCAFCSPLLSLLVFQLFGAPITYRKYAGYYAPVHRRTSQIKYENIEIEIWIRFTPLEFTSKIMIC